MDSFKTETQLRKELVGYEGTEEVTASGRRIYVDKDDNRVLVHWGDLTLERVYPKDGYWYGIYDM